MPMPRKYFSEEEKKAAHLEAARRYVQNNREKRAESSRKYSQAHKKETAAAARRRRAANPEKYREIRKEYEKTPRAKKTRQRYYQKNKDWMNERNKKYNNVHKEHLKKTGKLWKINNKQKYMASQKEWVENNPEKVRIKRTKYRKNNSKKVRHWNRMRFANKLKRTPRWADLEKIKQVYINCPKGMVVDHVIPLQGKMVSGLHIESNLQYLTPTENSIKGNRFSFEEFRKSKSYKIWIDNMNSAVNNISIKKENSH